MARPNFFIVGHPRSGSGRVDALLQSHPDVFMARKELHFFGSDLHYNAPMRTQANYVSHFIGSDGVDCVGESSTWYLASQLAAEEIQAFAPDSRVLILLRNPVQWLHSLHSHMVFAAYEDIVDFDAALDAERHRIQGRCLPPSWSIPAGGVHYTSLVDYTQQVQRYFDAFGPERVRVLLFDDLRDGLERAFDEVLRFLGLSIEYAGRARALRGTGRSRNANRVARNRRLQTWLKRPPQRAILQGLRPGSFLGHEWLIRGLHRANIRYESRVEMTAERRASLLASCLDEVDRLEVLLNRDLAAWKNP